MCYQESKIHHLHFKLIQEQGLRLGVLIGLCIRVVIKGSIESSIIITISMIDVDLRVWIGFCIEIIVNDFITTKVLMKNLDKKKKMV
jgi:hypothetical protein